jgi:hypothetical protein
MMSVQAHAAQVRRANFAGEIADAISLLLIPLYRSGCQIFRRELVGSLISCGQNVEFSLTERGDL